MKSNKQSPDTLHNNCSTLPLSNFIEIVLHGDLRWLVRGGNPSLNELSAAWDKILEEYVSLVKTNKSDSIFELYKKIKYTEWQIVFVDKCIYALKILYDEEIADLLNQRGFGIVQHSEDWQAYLKSLYAIEMSAKILVVLLNQYNAEYKLVDKEQGAPDNASAEDQRFRYEKELAMLSKYQGQRIIKEIITVMEYAAIINNYLEEQKSNKKTIKDG